MQEVMIKRAKELLADGTVNRVLAWKKGDTFYDVTPAVFETEAELSDMVYGCFCGSNLSKYLVKETANEGKILVFLKPCDTYSFNELVLEHRIVRENVYAVGIECNGKVDAESLRAAGAKGLVSAECDGEKVTVQTLYGEKVFNKEDVLLEKCKSCKRCMGLGCPAISMKDGKAHIDTTLCVGCGVCRQLCAFDAIV